jgi:selenocysteine lyase/cysteine desulfurase
VAAGPWAVATDEDAVGSRRERILASMAAVQAHETELFGRLLDGLAAMNHVTLYGKAGRRTPTVYFNVVGQAPRSVAEALAARGINVWNGSNYALELVKTLSLPNGAVRAGLVHYNDASEVDRLVSAVAGLA